jgi:hypothetical protein
MIPGMFGPITIRQTATTRYLLINGQVQGGALMHPGADIVGMRFEGPGPLSDTIYPLGWVLAGIQRPTASAVMIGLGSGAGITQLLYTCPGVDVTCVEIDPAIIQVCRESFPLIPYYEDQGRLQIICSDAAEYLRNSTDHWSFGCADAYTGGSNDTDVSSLSPLLDRCDAVYINAIGTLDGKLLSDLAQCCAEHDKPVQEYFKATQPPARRDGLANWILTTDTIDWAATLAADPFGDIASPGAQQNADLWLAFLATAAKANC